MGAITAVEVITIIISIFSLVVSGIAIIIAFHSSKISSVKAETNMRNLITVAKEKLTESSKELQLNENTSNYEVYKSLFLVSNENLLNAYEEICARYVNNAINKKNFKNMYRTEIEQLVLNAEYQSYFSTPSSKYKYIVTVYNEWNRDDRRNK